MFPFFIQRIKIWDSPHLDDTVDGRNPAPPGMYKILDIIGYLPYQLVSRISEPSTVCSRSLDDGFQFVVAGKSYV